MAYSAGKEGVFLVRVLRYPRLSALSCTCAMALAIGRDLCVSHDQSGWADVLLILTLVMLAASFSLLSCRFIIDSRGVGVGFLLRMRRVAWEDLGAVGALCCNSRRMYFYGLYGHTPDFLHMLHRAPQCGPWGFVVPLNKKLASAIGSYCPYEIDLYTGVHRRREKGMHPVWHHAALQLLTSLPIAAAAGVTSALLLARASEHPSVLLTIALTLSAAGLIYGGLSVLYRAYSVIQTCPFISENGVSAGRGLYLTWDEVHFGYVHRMAQASGLFLLSVPAQDVNRTNKEPVRCLSMPDASTLVLAYLTYCPHANKAVEA